MKWLHGPSATTAARRHDAPLPRRRLLASLAVAGAALAAAPRASPAPAGAAVTCGPLALADVTARSGIGFVHQRGGRGDKQLPETMGAGLAWLDYDGDGWVDLYLVQSGPFPPTGEPAAANRLYRNRGDGSFADVTAASGAGDRGYGQGAVAADADGDGEVDLLVTNFGGDALLRNRGDGTFAPVDAGLPADGWSVGAAFADADGDRDLDLYIARYLELDLGLDLFCGEQAAGLREYCDPALFPAAADRYYENLGGGRWREATAAAGLVETVGKGLGVLFVDLDDDGRPEVYVADDQTPNLLWRNLGGGRFQDVSLLSGAAADRDGAYLAGMGVAAGDVDGDGDPDLVVTNFDVEINTLYKNLGALTFEDVAAASGFGPPSFNLLGFGVVLADLDRDGDLDAYVGNGHIFEQPKRQNVTWRQRDLLLLGDGGGRFAEQRCSILDDHPEVARGVASADWDGDGDVDLAISRNGGPPRLLESAGPERPWVGARLVGRSPNSEAVGAVLRLFGEAGIAQSRWVTAGDSYASSSDRRVLFAAPASGPRALEVRWPGGRRQRILSPPTGRYLVIGEP